MAKFEIVPLAELKAKIPRDLLPMVEEFKGHLAQLSDEQGGRLRLEKGDDPKALRRVLKAAAAAMNKQVRFPFRGEEGAVSFYLQEPKKRRGRKPKEQAQELAFSKPGGRRRGRPKAAG